MLICRREGWFGRRYHVTDNARPVATFELARFREHAAFEWENAQYVIRGSGWRGTLVMTASSGREVARAERAGWLSSRARLRLPDRTLELGTRGFWMMRHVLWHGSRELGEIRASFTTRQLEADLPDELPGPVRIFVLVLVLITRRRRAAAAAAAG